jgi:hypothetical protein
MAGVRDEVARLAARLDALESENERLRSVVTSLTGASTAPGGDVDDEGGDGVADPRFARRQLLGRLGGMAAAATVGSVLLDASPAAALDPPVVLKGDNDAAGQTTTWHSIHTGTGRALPILSMTHGNGTAIEAEGASSAITAESNSNGGTAFFARVATPEITKVGFQASGNGLGAYGMKVDLTGEGSRALSLKSDAPAIEATSNSHVIIATAGGGDAVRGISSNGSGVYGESSDSNGVEGVSEFGVGVTGSSLDSAALRAKGGSEGGRLLLDPKAGIGAPSLGDFDKGELVVDSSGSLWICTVGGSNGVAQWKRIGFGAANTAGTGLLTEPVRLVDTRGGAPVTHGGAKIAVDEAVTVQITGPTTGVPAGALGVIGNLACTDTGGAGFLKIYPAQLNGTPTSAVNYSAAGQTVSNAVTVALSPSGTVKIQALGSAAHVIFDVTGYVA